MARVLKLVRKSVSPKCLLNRELTVDARDPYWQLSNVVNEGVVDGSVHVRKVLAGLLIDGNAEGMNTRPLGFRQRLPGVFNSVFATVAVIVIGLSIGQRDQEACSRAVSYTHLTLPTKA